MDCTALVVFDLHEYLLILGMKIPCQSSPAGFTVYSQMFQKPVRIYLVFLPVPTFRIWPSLTICPSTASIVVALTSGSIFPISALEIGVRLFRTDSGEPLSLSKEKKEGDNPGNNPESDGDGSDNE